MTKMLCKRATSSSLPSTVLSSSRLRVGYTVPSPSPDRAPAIVSISTMKANPFTSGVALWLRKLASRAAMLHKLTIRPWTSCLSRCTIGAYCQHIVCNRSHYPLRSADLGSLLNTVWTDGLALDIVLEHSVDKAQDGSLTTIPEAG